jgi:predicted metal-dependent peptidase
MASIEQAMTQAVTTFPYFGAGLFRCKLIKSDHPDLEDVATDMRGNIYYSEAAMAVYPKDVAGGLLAREFLAWLLKHHERRRNRGPMNWAISSEAARNETILFSGDSSRHRGVALPSDAIRVKQLKGCKPDFGPEEIYETLPPEPSVKVKVRGSSVTGEKQEWEIEVEGEGISPEEADLIREFVKEEAQKALAQNRGDVPGNLIEELGLCLQGEDEVDRILRRIRVWADTKIKATLECSWSKLPRRKLQGILNPGKEAWRPDVVVIIDSSGSMDEDDLMCGMRCVKTVTNRFASCKVVVGDVHAHFAAEVFGPESVEMRGRGGTRMANVMRETSERFPGTPQIMVTDCETDWPAEGEIDAEVFVLATRQAAMDSVPDYYECGYIGG